MTKENSDFSDFRKVKTEDTPANSKGKIDEGLPSNVHKVGDITVKCSYGNASLKKMLTDLIYE